MGFGDHFGTGSAIGGAGLLALSAAFGGLLLLDARRRANSIGAVEARYYSGRLRRRGVVVVLLGLMGAAILFTARIDPQADRDAARLWIGTWLGVLLGALGLLIIAGFDWAANRSYARDRGLELIEQHRETLAEVYARARSHRVGPPDNQET